MIIYRLEFAPQKLIVRLEEKGTRRILYQDTLKTLAKPDDKTAIDYLTKIHLRAHARSSDVSFQEITLTLEQSLEALQLLSKTGRLYLKNIRLDLKKSAKIYWKEEFGLYSALLGDIPIHECQKVFPTWAIHNESIIPIEDVPWKWVEFFVAGPRALDDVQKKKFLREDLPILRKSEEVIPELVLTDNTGCFANLRKGEDGDLIEAGYARKIVGESHYYCPGDKVLDTLNLLLSCGWKVFSSMGKQVIRQSSVSWDVKEENGKIAVIGKVTFGSVSTTLKSVMQGAWVDLNNNTVGLVNREKFTGIDGAWEGEKLFIKKHAIHTLHNLFQGDVVKWEANLQEMVQGFTGVIPEADVHIQGTLLPYQQKGVNWLVFLKKWGFSGLLADEMGLGKTVQVLAFFSHLRTNLPLLVVAPSSLLYQWKREVLRFLPGTQVYVHAGESRKTDLSNIQGIIITSYALLRQDVDLFASLHFEVIVLDEANAIKTAGTLTAKSACKLRGNFRISLTGTPMENRFDELLSQFHFLMPDFCISHPKQIKPFILRRRKQDVLNELPEKIEQISWIEMTEPQESLYQEYVTKFKEGLLTKIAQDGISAHRMEVLEAILRLRQICDDPRLIGSEIQGAKIERLLEDIEDHKVIIFSQFTSMLELVKQALKEKGLEYLYLDGSIASEERMRLVEQYQTDPNSKIFISSLKAGGVGLNLTAAEYVFLLDPWWNDAVEQQAIARAHRIGQKNTLIAKRYLVPNSIEEKMLSLKEKKNEAQDLLLDGEEFNWSEADLLHLLTL